MQNARLGESQTGIKIARRNIKNLSYADAAAAAKSLQLCPILCDPMDCSPPGSSVHGILQARILEWVSMPSFRGYSQPGIEFMSLTSPALAGGFFTTRQPHLSFKKWVHVKC